MIAGLIRRSFSYLSPRLFRQLFTTFVRTHLEYAQAVWSPKLRKHINLIDLIDGLKYLAYEERLKRLEYRRTLCGMVEVYKYLNVYDRQTIPRQTHSSYMPKQETQFTNSSKLFKRWCKRCTIKIFLLSLCTNLE